MISDFKTIWKSSTINNGHRWVLSKLYHAILRTVLDLAPKDRSAIVLPSSDCHWLQRSKFSHCVCLVSRSPSSFAYFWSCVCPPHFHFLVSTLFSLLIKVSSSREGLKNYIRYLTFPSHSFSSAHLIFHQLGPYWRDKETGLSIELTNVTYCTPLLLGDKSAEPLPAWKLVTKDYLWNQARTTFRLLRVGRYAQVVLSDIHV